MAPASPPRLVGLARNAPLAVTGDDATTFLHGPLPHAVAALEPGQAQWTGWCSPKGRLIASLLLARKADGFLAMLPAELAPAVAKKLSMYVLRSKVKIADASGAYARYGVVGAGSAEAVRTLGGDGELLALPIAGDIQAVIAPRDDARLEALRRVT